MKSITTPVLAFVLLAASSSLATPRAQSDPQAFSAALDAGSILRVANAVADGQPEHPYRAADWDWTDAALWTGLLAHAETTGDERYLEALERVSRDLGFKLGPRAGMADDHCVGQLHLWHYLRDEIPAQLAPTLQTMTAFIERPHDESLLWVNNIHMREWAWCDALYMGPPTLAGLFAATGDRRFLDVMVELWEKTTAYLYDEESGLYWRDSKYFDQREANGEKVFWSRGNGWVFAGLCNLLRHLPEGHPEAENMRRVFRKMAAKLKAIQQEDGSWRSSLLDPASFSAPESSGTAFFCYGFLFGINNGLLDGADYGEVAFNAWRRLVRSVHADGKLGFVQPIGENPKKVTIDMTAVYGVGGFLQAAHELHQLVILREARRADCFVANDSGQVRLNEVIEIPWDLIEARLGPVRPGRVGLRDGRTGRFSVVQEIDADGDGTPELMLFRADLLPGTRHRFELCRFEGALPRYPGSRLRARLVPERKDDFSWENDRIAYRAYGPALAAEGARGGIDVWTKSVRRPVADGWYAAGESYHEDRGEGLDGYAVGSSLGCGGLGYLGPDGKLVSSSVFEEAEVLFVGPLRLSFRLSYPPVAVGGAKIRETRVVTMDAGDHHFGVRSSFRVEGDAAGIRPAAGLVIRDANHNPVGISDSSIAYWDPIMAKEHGHIGTFLLHGPELPSERRKLDQHLLKILAPDLDASVTYAAGAIWQKVDVASREAFADRVLRIRFEENHPLEVD